MSHAAIALLLSEADRVVMILQVLRVGALKAIEGIDIDNELLNDIIYLLFTYLFTRQARANS